MSLQQRVEAAAIVHKLQLVKEFEATRLGIVLVDLNKQKKLASNLLKQLLLRVVVVSVE